MSALHGLKGKVLDLVLHSPGGSLEAADQIVQYIRSKYEHIRAIIPQNAMSAATMIACACDEIVMGKQSAIGPTDPQITFPTPSGDWGTISHFSAWTASTSGDMLFKGSLTTPKTVNNGDPAPAFGAGALQITFA